MLTGETLNQIKSIEAISSRCLLTYYYYKLTSNANNPFLTLVQNTMGENCCLLWCHIFGKKSDDLHFRKFFARPDVVAFGEIYSAENVIERLRNRIGYSTIQYEEFWRKMNDCRDKYISHRDLNSGAVIFPDIEKCKIMIEELRLILREIVESHHSSRKENDLSGLLLSLYRYNLNSGFEQSCRQYFESVILDGHAAH